MKINKQFLTALLVFLVLGVCTLLLFFLLPSAAHGAAAEPVTLSDRAQNAFASAEVTNAGGSYTVTAEDGVFACDLLAGLPVSQAAFEQLAQQCTSLTAEGPVAPPSGSGTVPDYGFDHPLAQVKAAYSDGGGIFIEVGAQIAGTDQYYIRVDHSASVYRIGKEAIRCLLADISAYLDLSLTPDGADRDTLPSRISVNTGAQSLQLEKLPLPETDGAGFSYRYRLAGDRAAYVDPDAYETYFGELGELEADGVVTMRPTSVDLKEYGLADEEACDSISFTMLGESVRLRLGNRSGDFYYVLREGVPAIYRLSRLAVTWEDADEYALMSRYLMAPALDKVQEILIEGGGVRYHFTLQNGSASLDGTPLTASTFDSFYALLCSLRAEYKLGAPAQNIPPDLTVTFVYTDRAAPTASPAPEDVEASPYRTDVIRFIPYGPKRHAIEINGAALYAVRSTYATKVLGVLATLQDGQQVSASW